MRRELVPGGCPPALGCKMPQAPSVRASGSKILASSAAPTWAKPSYRAPPRPVLGLRLVRVPSFGGPAAADPQRQPRRDRPTKAARSSPHAVDATTATMALASAKSSALEDNNKAVATGMKWSIEARAEIPQAMRDEIEAEMATKRA